MTASEHRARARAALKGNWPWAALTSFVAVLLGAISASGGSFELDLSETESLSLGNLPESAQTLLVTVLGLSAVVGAVAAIALTIAQLILGGVVGIGYRKYLLNLIDGEEAVFDRLFSQFHRLGQALLVRVIQYVIGIVPTSAVSLLTFFSAAAGLDLLTVIGVIAMFAVIPAMIYVSYGFVMAEFLMAEDECCGAVDALKGSWAMMKGWRMDYFWLNLSFIGWELLAGFTFGIGGLFLTPYVQTADASFYRELRPRAQAIPGEGYTDCSGIDPDLP